MKHALFLCRLTLFSTVDVLKAQVLIFLPFTEIFFPLFLGILEGLTLFHGFRFDTQYVRRPRAWESLLAEAGLL